MFPSIERGDLPFMLIPLKHLKENTPISKRASRMPRYRLKWIGFGDNQMGDNIVLDLADTTPPAKQVAYCNSITSTVVQLSWRRR